MNNQSKLYRFMPYLVAIILFTAINVFYFAPQFAGKSLRQHDVIQYQGMAQDIKEHRAATGEDPQWEGRMFSGMPSYMIDFLYKGAVIKKILPVFNFLGQPASMIFIAMTAFFFMVVLMGLNPWVGVIGGLAYGLSSYFFIIIGAGHITKMIALAYAPMMFAGVYYAYRRNMWIGAAITALFGAIQLGVNHPQITYYFMFILVAFFISELVGAYKKRALAHFAKVTALLALAGVLAVGANSGMLWYAYDSAKETTRGGSELKAIEAEAQVSKGLGLDYATAWSYGKAETFNMLIPNLYGGSSEGGFEADGEVAQSLTKYNARGMATQLPGYWGSQPITSGPVYIGVVAIFLFLMGMFLLKGSIRWWVGTVSLVAIMLAWGHNFMWFTELFFNYFPAYNKFRTVSMILVIVEWTIPFLGAVVLSKIYNREFEKREFFKALRYSIIITGGISLLFLMFGSTIFSFSSGADAQLPEDVVAAMISERAALLKGDALRSLLFAGATCGVLWLFFAQKIKNWLFVTALAALVVVDMMPVNMRYLNHDKFVDQQTAQIQPTQADKYILQDKELGYRVLNLSVSTFNDATTSYFHRSVGGYHGAKLQRYQDLIDRHLSKMNMKVYDMLNTKYIITPDQQSGELKVQQNPGANGAAWFVQRADVVANANDEIAALDTTNTKIAAVIDQRFESFLNGAGKQADANGNSSAASAGVQADANGNSVATGGEKWGYDSTATIQMTAYEVNRQEYKYKTNVRSLAVFSEVYYPKGWTAYVDGTQVPYFRVDYILRAVMVEPGEHTVEFRFNAPNYDTLSIITLICSLLILSGILGAIFMAYKSSKTDINR